MQSQPHAIRTPRLKLKFFFQKLLLSATENVNYVSLPRALSISISIYFVQTCKIKPNKMTLEQDNKVQRIHCQTKLPVYNIYDPVKCI